ncbi:MAG: Rrf2 family transcriptional regulator [Phycisphaerae bacterium]
MITISQKCQYALRSVFELARHQRLAQRGAGGGEFATINDIAAAQAIPPGFLSTILNELKQAGLVDSRRGAAGGYFLTVDPKELTVGRIIRLVDGPIQPVKCIAGGGGDCPLKGKCAFLEMWQQAGDAISAVFDGTTFQELLDKHEAIGAGDNTYTI